MSPEQIKRSDELYKEKKIGMLLAEMRKHTGLTQSEIADRLGVGQSTISQMEGSEDMHLTTLKNIVAELVARSLSICPMVTFHLPTS